MPWVEKLHQYRALDRIKVHQCHSKLFEGRTVERSDIREQFIASSNTENKRFKEIAMLITVVASCSTREASVVRLSAIMVSLRRRTADRSKQ